MVDKRKTVLLAIAMALLLCGSARGGFLGDVFRNFPNLPLRPPPPPPPAPAPPVTVAVYEGVTGRLGIFALGRCELRTILTNNVGVLGDTIWGFQIDLSPTGFKRLLPAKLFTEGRQRLVATAELGNEALLVYFDIDSKTNNIGKPFSFDYFTEWPSRMTMCSELESQGAPASFNHCPLPDGKTALDRLKDFKCAK
jgi:hypothetical protein